MYDILIIGGGTAGFTAAIYSARAGKSVILLESSSIGGQIATSPRVENYPGILQISGMEFADKLYDQAVSLGVNVEIENVTGIEDTGDKKTVYTEYGSYDGKAVIIATGVKHKRLDVSGEDALAGRGVSYCAICDGAFFRNKTVAVIGGGSAALTSADLLSDGCYKVYLVHRRDEFRGEGRLVDALVKKSNVEFVLSSVIDKINGDSKVKSVSVIDLKSNSVSELAVDGVFISVGQAPDNRIFADLVELDQYGYIIAGEDTKTSCPGIFAAGDCRTKEVRQLTTAAADGAVAALAACDYIR